SCRPRRSTTPCPGWSCGGWAGWPGSGTRSRWTAWGCGWWRCTGRSHARCGSRRERGGGTGGHVSTAWALVLSALLLAGNAFFVAAEFALVASRRYRLEHAAADGSRAARAAVAGSRELSLMLAGAQLGITACTLGLGALAEPTVEHLLHPPLSAAGLPERTGTVVAFVVALLVVSFLHVVVGEMAPKSWAITQPERSALLLALPFRGFTRAVRPLLTVLQRTANGVLRLFGVEPQEALAAVHGPAELRVLLERSRQEGLLEPEHHQLLSRMLPLARTSLAEVMTPIDRLATVNMRD